MTYNLICFGIMSTIIASLLQRGNIYESEIIPGKNAMRSQQQSHEKEALSEKGIISGDVILSRAKQEPVRSGNFSSPRAGCLCLMMNDTLIMFSLYRLKNQSF